ncbi:hypothetical protein EUX98_g6198 [Antrodiella citrinella]|uniref:AAA+ ATPase domain-containing protein n=1 Tax=Antrodiella citrinella TaxID=2447956 RepID=A0A4S4MRH7_9APHY|nr:hypothetical protein EUX98_g6198 [Antrodiella citrinella]
MGSPHTLIGSALVPTNSSWTPLPFYSACTLTTVHELKCMQEAKITSRHTFFGAFADGVLDKFYASVSDWECRAALKGSADAKVDPTAPTGSRRSLSDAPPALTYLMLSSAPIMQNPKIMTTLQECTPTSTFSEWPTDIPPVGLLLLLMHDNAAVRSWARNQVATYKTTPMKSEQFLPTYVDVLSQVTKAIGLFDAQLSQVGNANDISQAWETLDIHAARLVLVAFGKNFASDVWKDARSEARKLIRATLLFDLKKIATAITHLCNPDKYTEPVVVQSVRNHLWKQTYRNIHHEDEAGVAIILQVMAQISHVDSLTDSAFADVIKHSSHAKAAKEAFNSVNLALGVFRDGFSDAVSRLADFSDSTGMLRLLRQATVAQDVMTLMFSPVDDLQQAAQQVAGLALDVETRQDCFRALLSAAPNQALNGMFSFLETFNNFAQTVPEACSVSKSLALCFTDIIDVMCSSPDGLLLQDSFTTSIAAPGAAVELPKWWALMTKALSIIFVRTPRWAVYFENFAMVEWMRDALIFGRDLLGQRKVIEAGALGPKNASSGKAKLTRIGKKMVDDLQQVLQELTRWLRLTDEELLFQSFALLQSLLGCFRESNVVPSEVTLQKLQKHLDDARKKDPSRPQTRLDAPRLARLQETLSSFEDDDDEIEIISHTMPPPKASSSTIAAKRVKEEPLRPKTAKSRLPDVTQIRAPPPTKKSAAFTANDQMRLESAASLPKFTKMSKPVPSASSSKLQKPTGRPTVVESSSSESESEDEGEGLASLAKIQRTPTIKKPTERRTVKLMDVPGNGRNPALERINRRDDARRTGLRLKPDVSSLHRRVLAWDYTHSGPSPPDEDLRLQHVPDTFADINHYRRIFEPLLLSECWAQIQQSKDEPQDNYECVVVSRQYADDWTDMEGTISTSVKSDWYLTDADIVVLTCTGSPKPYLGKVQSYKAQMNGIQFSVRFLLKAQDAGPQINTTWRLAKVFSLTTLHREYAALMGLPYYDLFDTILRPDLRKKTSVSPEELRQTMSLYKLNEPQAKAILSSMVTDGFSLIQGPPGTGKTSTICGLVQLFLTRRPKPATAIHVGRASGPGDREPPKKILLCAPSNAAIDEITFRLKEGVSGAGHKDATLKVVRVGAVKSMHASIKDVSLDALVDQKLNSDPNTVIKDARSEIASLRSQLESVRERRGFKLEEIANTHDNSVKTSALEEEIKTLNKQRLTLTHQLDKLRDKQKSDGRTLDAISRRCRYDVMQEADVICSTLAGAGHELLEAFDFEMVVIDEAAQSIELSSLIPLKYRCNRCVMVGDPQQLPPTVISQEASKFLYNQSLFVRLQKRRPDAVHLLSIQYRMHPDISRLPSSLFYSSRLLDGPDMASKTQRPWHSNTRFGTYRFYNVNRGQEQAGSHHSLVNRVESQIAAALYQRLKQEFSSYDFEYKVGVVTMYRAQIGELRRTFEQRFGSEILSTVDFNTVDGFQGQEKEIIILSCVRAGPGLQNVGFLSDIRRMNVALTRAKSSLFVLGHAATLERSDATWRNIVVDARERSCLVDTDMSYFTSARDPVPSSSSIDRLSKPASKAATQPAHIPPPGLLTPQELAANRPTPLASTKGKGKAIEDDSNRESPVAAPAAPVVPQKRRQDEDDTEEPAIGSGNHAREKSQQKPRIKRPKPAAPSLFIPKKR